MESRLPRPVPSGSKTIRGRNVEFVQGHEWHMGKTRTFWRADYRGVTIASLCRTKAECVGEVRRYFKQQDEQG